MKPIRFEAMLRPVWICFVLFFCLFSVFLSGCLTPSASEPPDFALSDADARQAGALALYAKGLLYESGEGCDTNTAKDSALAAYRQAVCLDPDNRRPLASMILNLVDRERYGEALTALEVFLKRHPGDIEMRLEAARIADSAERPADAARHCAVILSAQPANRELAQALTRLYFQSDQVAQALHVMRSQYERFPDKTSSALPVQWAVHFTRESKYPDRALACLDLALHQRTNTSERAALNTLAAESLFQLGQTNAAVANLQQAYRKCPSLNAPILRLGTYWAGQTDATNRLAQQAQRERNPNETLLILAATQQARGDEDAAAATLKHVYALRMRAGFFPDEGFYLWLGSLLEASKSFDEAERFFLDALAAYPSSHEIKNFLAYMWAEKGIRLNEAERLSNDALLAVPTNSAYLDTKGWILFKKNRYFDALQFLLKAAELDKDEPVILDHAGDVLLAVGRESEAVAFWTRSHQLDPVTAVADKLSKHGVTQPSK